ncbi:hypothetical protein SARC_05741 [Sphaeroforma arctica JP610]|uniref:Uncharacterized protein n=1 Tax=Sphaeroforma arctica JP610 TaxID=667725 RepID=A0A0L0FYQ6_9EUKA|nr:hypothetical protein SARC_05741 [Sphaeroforma arctica JP610]KNC81965.1 hypothetical protein SARC_05741 [Sphaeroforma arctica JP610]|eukprot:XP_014155867.1 hypothetical protein SARC_05741 [Sphaeroforma arctica JP610]
MGSRSGSLPSMEAIVQNGALAGRHPAQRARHLLTGSPKFDRPRSKSMSVKQGQTPTSAQGSALSQAQLITWQLGLANQRLADGEMDMNESAFALGAQSEADIPSSLQLSDFNSHMSHNTHHGSEGNLSLGASGVMDFATHPASEGRSSVGSHGNGAGGVADLASTPLGDGGLPGSSSGPNSKRSTSGTLSRNVSGGTGSGSADKVNETVARVQNIMSHGQITDEQALALKDTLTALTNLKALQERQDSRGSGTSAGGGLVAGSSGSMSGSGEVTPGIVTEAKCSSNVGVLPSIGEYVTEVVDVLEEALAKFTFSMRPGGGKTAPGTGVMGANHITNLAMRSPMGTIMDGGSLSGSMLNSPILHRSAISSPQVSLEAPIGLPAPLNDGSSGVIDAPSLTSLNLADFDMNNLGNLDGLIPGAEYPNGCDNMRSSLSSQNLVGASPGETFSPMFGDMGAEHEDLDLNIMMDPFLSSDLYGPMGNVAELDLSTGPLPDSLRGSLGSDVGNIGNTPRTATMTDPAGLSGGGLDAGLGIGMDEDTHMNDAYSPIAGTDTTHMDASAKATQPPQYVEGTASGGATGSPHMSPRAAPGDKDRTGAHPFQPIEITTDGLVSPSPPPRSTPEAGSPNTGQALEGNMHLDDGKSVATPSNDLPVPHGRSGPGSSPLARQGQVFEKPTNSLAGIRGELMEGAVEGMNGLLDTFSGWSGNSWGSEEKKQ